MEGRPEREEKSMLVMNDGVTRDKRIPGDLFIKCGGRFPFQLVWPSMFEHRIHIHTHHHTHWQWCFVGRRLHIFMLKSHNSNLETSHILSPLSAITPSLHLLLLFHFFFSFWFDWESCGITVWSSAGSFERSVRHSLYSFTFKTLAFEQFVFKL